MTEQNNNQNTSRVTWSQEDYQKLKKSIMENKPLERVYLDFQDRSPASVRSKLHKIRINEGIQPETTRAYWNEDEDLQLSQAFSEGQNIDQIKLAFPYRTKRAISSRLINLGLTEENRQRQIERIPWNQIQVNNYVEVQVENWPVTTPRYKDKSLYMIVNRQFFENNLLCVNVCRSFLKKAEERNKSNVRFLVCENKENLIEILRNQKRKPPARQLDQKGENLVRASMLADGCLVNPNPQFLNTFFQFTQAASFLTKNNASHLEYAVWFLLQIVPSALTAVPFTLERGISKNDRSDGLAFTWKARVWLWNLNFFPNLLAENYYSFPETETQVFNAKRFTSRGALRDTLGQTAENPIDIANIPSNDRFIGGFEHSLKDVNINEPAIRYKVLPSDTNLDNLYFKDAGFTIAHIYMQNGALFKLSSRIKIPTLFIQTKNPYQVVLLAKAIYRNTGLKFLPSTYWLSNNINYTRTILYLCPYSVNLFINLTKDHILPCMNYKKPSEIDTTDLLNKSVIDKYNNLFEEFINSYL